MKIAVITEEGLLKIHKFEYYHREQRDIEEYLSGIYDLNSINYQVIEDIEIEELFEVYSSTVGCSMNIIKDDSKFFVDLDKAKEYYEKLIEEIKKDHKDLDEETTICIKEIVGDDYIEYKNLEQIIEEIEDGE